ncbi:hypothetical protein GXW83_02150 [Streptacidiphilus sp. PB12-B1b]|uniref:TauD/TfdA family dioxygenase n=1 Tax=Streptacidiphilus sp. PB12-B1b TaxID=2705012 RepID=UPI0015FA089B|nr:TauD/TfdA family dioxygenase [Streptacidiphilus sp. PB12-B1b]QMU74757.1 hypothetical protein GXW83_02150 [Streptacidiphilus sp. PB12-B1b]
MFVDLPHELEGALTALAGTLPAWSMEGTFLSASTIERYGAELASAPLSKETTSSLRHALGDGYAIVRLGKIAEALDTGDQFLRLVTAILTEVATPFQPIQRFSLWKPIGTNLKKNPGMTSGTGYNAFHIDLVNATRPPDYTVLLCVRPDSLGAGASILSDAHAAVSRLSPASRALLAEPAYSYGRFFELSDVGKEYRPFPVLDGDPEDLDWVRFTAKMLSEPGADEAHARAAQELSDEMTAGQESVMLQRGDLLIVNQHRYVHGREPLADGQDRVPEPERRLLQQLFLRSSAQP